MKKSKKGQTPETSAFQQLFLLVGIHLFKVCNDCKMIVVVWQDFLDTSFYFVLFIPRLCIHVCLYRKGSRGFGRPDAGSAELHGKSPREEVQEEEEAGNR